MKFASHKGKWFVQDTVKGGWVNADGKVETVTAGAKFFADLTSAKAAGFSPSSAQAGSISSLPPVTTPESPKK